MLHGWQFWVFLAMLITINIYAGAYIPSALLILGLIIVYHLPEHE